MKKNTHQKIFSDVSVMGSFQLIQYALGFANLLIIAAYFGANNSTDAFFMALSVITIFSKFLLEASFEKLCVPFMVRYKHDLHELSEITAKFVCFIGLIFSLITILPFTFAKEIVRVIAPGFDDLTRIQTVQMIRIICPVILISYLIGIYRAFLHVTEQFKTTAAGDVLQKLINIGVILCLAPFLGIMSLAYGIFTASFFNLIFFIASSVRKGLRLRIVFDFRSPHIKEMLMSLRPLFAGGIASQFTVWASSLTASMLTPGSLSGFVYALRIREVLVNFIGNILPVITYPNLSEKVALGEKEKEEVYKLLKKSIKITFLVFLPVIVFICVSSVDIIKICLQRGQFTQGDSYKVGIALIIMLVGIIPYNANTFLLNTLYAYKKTGKIALTRFFQNLIQGCLYFVLVPFIGFFGLPASRSTASTTNFLFYSFQLRKDLPLKSIFLNMDNLKIFFINIVMFLVCLFISSIPILKGQNIGCTILRIISSGMGGLLTYLFLCWLIKIEELGLILGVLKDGLRDFNIRKIQETMRSKI